MRSLEVDIHSPQPFDFSSPEDYVHYTDRMDADFANRPGSVSGFGVGLQAWSYGFRLSGLHSCIKTEWTIWFLELSLSLKASLELGFRGLVYLVTATWRGTSDAISISFGVSAEGLIMRFEYATLSSNFFRLIHYSYQAGIFASKMDITGNTVPCKKSNFGVVFGRCAFNSSCPRISFRPEASATATEGLVSF
jgi:hypothetical protein